MSARYNTLSCNSTVPVAFPNFEPDTDQSGSCVCERPVKTILCRACGHIFPGRLRIACPVHPTTIHLMDIRCCPACNAMYLKEFKSPAQKEKK